MLERLDAAFTERAESQDRLRRFVADASHELRTPVTTIRGYAELYRVGGLADRTRARRGDAAHRAGGRAHGPPRRRPPQPGQARPGPAAGATRRSTSPSSSPTPLATPAPSTPSVRSRRDLDGPVVVSRRRGPAAPGRRQHRRQRARPHATGRPRSSCACTANGTEARIAVDRSRSGHDRRRSPPASRSASTAPTRREPAIEAAVGSACRSPMRPSAPTAARSTWTARQGRARP